MVLRRGADASATSTSSRSRALRLLEGRAGDRSCLVGARGDRERRPRARPVEGDAVLADLPARRCCARGSEDGRRAERACQINGHRCGPLVGVARAVPGERDDGYLGDVAAIDRGPTAGPARPVASTAGAPTTASRVRTSSSPKLPTLTRRSPAASDGSGIAAGRSRSRNLSMWKICSVDSAGAQARSPLRGARPDSGASLRSEDRPKR